MGDYADIDLGERNKLRNKIYRFSQYDNESLTESWVKFQELLKNCYGHGLDRMQQVITFYERLNSDSKYFLDLAGGGDFYYMSPNEVCRMMENLVEECKCVKFDPLEENRVKDDLELDRVEMVETETETSAEKTITAPHSRNELRRSFTSEEFTAPQSPNELRRSDTTEEEDDSGDEDLFNELYELIAEDNLEEYVGKIEKEELEDGLDGLETVSPTVVDGELELDRELRELIRENVGMGAVFEGMDIDNVNSEKLEAFLNFKDDPVELVKGLSCLETIFPNKVIKEAMVIEVKEETNGGINSDVVDHIVLSVLLLCRKKTRGAYLKRKKCKVRCEHVVMLTMLVIFACTKEWNDAIVQNFEKVFVANELCEFYVWFWLDNFRNGLT